VIASKSNTACIKKIRQALKNGEYKFKINDVSRFRFGRWKIPKFTTIKYRKRAGKYRVGFGSFLKKIAVFFKILPPKNDIFEIFGNPMFLLVGGGTSKKCDIFHQNIRKST